MRIRLILLAAALAALPAPASADADPSVVLARMGGFDTYMKQIVKDWNTPGIVVGVVAGDKLVFAKGYGYRDYGRKLPMTPQTLFQIASNTKLFTAVAAGMLVDQGKLSWDEPIRNSVPAIRFYNDELNDQVTLRDMLAHRTGVTRHDAIWEKSPFTPAELFEKLRYLEPQEPIRTTFLYNNLMYGAAGYIVGLQSGGTWQQFVKANILDPLGMHETGFGLADLLKSPDHVVPYTEHRDTNELYKLPDLDDPDGIPSAGAIVSNVEDLSHWLIALMNAGTYSGKAVLPSDVLAATMQPAIALPNSTGESLGWWELLNADYGMGRFTASYRGHLLTYHGGDLPGIHSQISFMPNDHIGVIVAVIGDHDEGLYSVVTWNLYDRLLGLDEVPWSRRFLDLVHARKHAETEHIAKTATDRIADAPPSHPLAAYVGRFRNPAYGDIVIASEGPGLHLTFHGFSFPLNHYHYDRFDTPEDENYGKFSLDFRTSPAGEIDALSGSLDESEVTFTRVPEPLSDAQLQSLAGIYLAAGNQKVSVTYRDGTLSISAANSPPEPLLQVKDFTFRTKEFADVLYEFVVKNGSVKAMNVRDPSGETSLPRASP